MSLRAALLVLLELQPMTGYDLHQSFQRSTANLWRATDAQIYPELRRMEADRLVDGVEEPWGPKSVKRRYSITDEGRAFVRRWMRDPVHYSDSAYRDPMRLRAGYFEWTDEVTARKRLQEHIRHHEQRIAFFQSLVQSIEALREPGVLALRKNDSVLAKRLLETPPQEHERIIEFKLFAFDGMISVGKAEVAWAKRGIRLLTKLS